MQRKLSAEQVEMFHHSEFVREQAADFQKMLKDREFNRQDVIVDIGGGVGHFATLISNQQKCKVRILDVDEASIKKVFAKKNDNVDGLVADALSPPIFGDERGVTLNLILHHLVGDTEALTQDLQQKAVSPWKSTVDWIFINEYIYESFCGNISGKLIYWITANKFLSYLAAFVAKFIPSLKANTFGVGVRFRAHKEWLKLFNAWGFDVVSVTEGKPEFISPPRRILLLRKIQRNSYLLKPSQ